jgi:CHAD domain-containing protein
MVRPRRARQPGVHQHLLASLKGAGKRYRKEIERCQERFSEEAVHELRVELRRVLALVELIGVFVPERRVRKALKLLKKQLDLFAELRDTQVQALWLRKVAPRRAGALVYQKHLRSHEARCVRQARRAIKAFRPARLQKLIESFRTELRARRKQGLEPGDWARVRHSVVRAFAEVARLNRRAKGSDARTIHRTRIAFKKYRYMIETLAPWLQEDSPRDLQALHDHQTLMGNVQDLEVLKAGVSKFLRKRKQETKAIRALLEGLEAPRRAAVARFLKRANRLTAFAPHQFLDAGRTPD